ncbi:MAG: T9SS type A sorting domain-containing protein [Bacteroidetes bacterium]|nr:T9SS type A sorting domain-containing protein [Bacteroidota bacterium]
MKKLTFIISLIILSSLAVAQSVSDSLETNELKASVLSAGDLFRNANGNPSFEAPKGSGVSTIYASNLWIGGIDETGSLLMAAQTYRQSGTDYWHGPVSNNYDSAYDAQYDRVWKISKTEIDDHISSWASPGYAAPDAIINWPAHGDTTKGEAWLLAPFVDHNQDQIYNPFQGDYPAIRGDEAMFFIYNDLRSVHTETGGQNLGVEIHGLAYAFSNPEDTALNQTLFVNFNIFNRQGGTINDTYVGLWTDFDIGYYRDDWIGTDTSLNLAYGYNSNNTDGNSGGYGYGMAPPAQGLAFLNQSLDRTMMYKNDFSAIGNPVIATEFYGYLQSYWKDGSPLTYGGSGYDTTANATSSSYVFPGNPVDSTGWTSADTAAFDPTDARMIASHGPFLFEPGTSVCMDIAFIFARDTTGNHLSNVNLLKSYTAHITDFYNQQNFSCEQVLTSIQPPVKPAVFNVYPNPGAELLILELSEIPSSTPIISVVDMSGRRVITRKMAPSSRLTLDLPDLSAGLYIVELRIGDQIGRKKWIKQ